MNFTRFAPDYDPFWDEPLWGAKPIGEALNRNERAVYHLVSRQLIDVDHVGFLLCTTRRRLLKPRKAQTAE